MANRSLGGIEKDMRNLFHALGETVKRMSDGQLANADRAIAELTSANCWWAMYDCRAMLKRLVDIEVMRRTGKITGTDGVRR